jgi:hypothetical protein
VTLAFCGFPAQKVHRMLYNHFKYQPVLTLMSYYLGGGSNEHIRSRTIVDIIASADPTSVHHITTTSPKSLAEAAEAILKCLMDQVHLLHLSTYSMHKSWLLRTKPGKHIATGTPRLASVFHTLCISSLLQKNLFEQVHQRLYRRSKSSNGYYRIFNLQTLSKVLGPKYDLTMDGLRRRGAEITIVVDLLKALLWLLPKAGFSEKIVRYSKRTFSRDIYRRKPDLIHRVRKSLDNYTTRVQNAKLEDLGQRIENGEF